MPSQNPSPRPRTEAKIIVGVVVVLAVVLAVFLFWGPELRSVSDQPGEDGGIEAPTDIYSAPADAPPAAD